MYTGKVKVIVDGCRGVVQCWRVLLCAGVIVGVRGCGQASVWVGAGLQAGVRMWWKVMAGGERVKGLGVSGSGQSNTSIQSTVKHSLSP